MRILFCGATSARWMYGWQRCQTLKELKQNVAIFDLDGYVRATLSSRLVLRLRRIAFDPVAVHKLNADFLERVKAAKPDVAWIEKALMLRAETLAAAREAMPSCTFVCFQEDDPFGLRKSERAWWKHFKEAIPVYDLHFVKKDVDLAEFRAKGARNVALFTSGYYPGMFHPHAQDTLDERYRKDVIFVGTALDHRVSVIGELVKRHRLPVSVYGGMWKRTLLFYTNRRTFHPAAVEDEYVKLVSGARISLGFVSSTNRDEYSHRSFEIPACKGFFLAERTPRHMELYTEGKEAEFFGSSDECADKIRFYLSHESARAAIADAGYSRCIDSGYSLHNRLSEALQIIRNIRR